MSLWFYSRNKKSIYAVDLPMEILLVLIMLTAALMIPRYMNQPSKIHSDAMILLYTGFGLFLIAKISVILKGHWVSWGYSLMSRPFKYCYLVGYCLMGAGAVIILTLRFAH